MHDGCVVRWNVLDGSFDKSEQLVTEQNYYITPTENYITIYRYESPDKQIEWIVAKNDLSRTFRVDESIQTNLLPISGDRFITDITRPSEEGVRITIYRIVDDGQTISLETVLDKNQPMFNYITIDLKSNVVDIDEYANIEPLYDGKSTIVLGIQDNGNGIIKTDSGLVKIADGTCIPLGLPQLNDGIPQPISYCVSDDYLYMLCYGVYATVVARISLATLDIDYSVLSIINNTNVSGIGGNSIKVDGDDIWLCVSGIPFGSSQGNFILSEQKTLICRIDINSAKWISDLNAVEYTPYAVWDAPDVFANGGKFSTLIDHGEQNTFVIGCGYDEKQALMNGLIVHCPTDRIPATTFHVSYMGNADSVVIPPILGDYANMIYPSAASISPENGFSVHIIASNTHNFYNNTQEYIFYAHESTFTATGRELYETGVGFKSIYYDQTSGRYRYYMDTGAYIEFDADGNVVAKGEKGDKGDSIPIDSELSSTSTNAVQNKVVNSEFSKVNTSIEEVRTSVNDVNTDIDIINGSISSINTKFDSYAPKNGGTSDFQANAHFFKSIGGWNNYERIVIPILEITSSVSDDRYSNGKIFAHRDNGLYQDPHIEWYCNKSYSSTASEKYALKVTSINLFRMAEFTYNSKKYLGVVWDYTSSQSKYCYFDGYTNQSSSPLFTKIPYYTNKNNSVLNNEIYNSLKSVSVPSQNIPPVNTVYIQFKGESAPADIFGGTWTNISSQHAGQFFRAEGTVSCSYTTNGSTETYSNAAVAFGSVQKASLPNITGTIGYGENNASFSPSGAFYKSGTGLYGSASSDNDNTWAYFDASRSNKVYGAIAENNSVATMPIPPNETMRIWKRTG